MKRTLDRFGRTSELATRIAFTAVFALNVMCALQFVIAPGEFAGAYQLSGVSGEAAVRGIGIAFLMWNATYPLFIWKPSRHMALGVIILVQQLIGCIGETCILLTLPSEGHELLASSIMRFIAFDAGGFVVMLVTFIFMVRMVRMHAPRRVAPSN